MKESVTRRNRENHYQKNMEGVALMCTDVQEIAIAI
jgi:hypothetical protein